MENLELCVRMSNESVRRINRHVDYVHMPVVHQPDAAFFEPLRHIAVDDTRVFLGMVHHTDGIDDYRRRRDVARKFLPVFGIASVCGYGRVAPDQARGIQDLHAEDAAEL